MFSVVRARIKDILFSNTVEFTELQNGFVLILWGLWLMILEPFGDRSGDTFAILERQAPAWFWGSITLVLGIAKLYGLILQYYSMRVTVSMLVFVWWFYMFLAIALANPHVFGVPATLVFSLTAAWGHIRLRSYHE